MVRVTPNAIRTEPSKKLVGNFSLNTIWAVIGVDIYTIEAKGTRAERFAVWSIFTLKITEASIQPAPKLQKNKAYRACLQQVACLKHNCPAVLLHTATKQREASKRVTNFYLLS